MGAFKTVLTKKINQIRNTPGIPLWQRNYYEHIVRDDRDYMKSENTLLTILQNRN